MKINDSTKTVTITANDVAFLENWRQNDGHEGDSIFDALSAIRDDASLGDSGAAEKSLDALKNASDIIIGTEYGDGPSFPLSSGFFAEPAAEFVSPRMGGPRVTVNSSVTAIGTSAFEGFKLDSVRCKGPAGPAPLAIGEYAFATSDLRAFDSDVPVDLFPRAFSNAGNLQAVQFRDYAGHVPENCFAYCGSLKGISFGLSDMSLRDLTDDRDIDGFALSIGNGAFMLCGNLQNVSLSDGLYISKVGESAFEQAVSLGSIDLSNAVSVEKYAFYHSNLDVSASHVGNLKLVESQAFEGCRCPAELVFAPDAVIADNAFPDNVTVVYAGTDPAIESLRKSAAMFDLEEADSDGRYRPVSRRPIPDAWKDMEDGNTVDDYDYNPID